MANLLYWLSQLQNSSLGTGQGKENCCLLPFILPGCRCVTWSVTAYPMVQSPAPCSRRFVCTSSWSSSLWGQLCAGHPEDKQLRPALSEGFQLGSVCVDYIQTLVFRWKTKNRAARGGILLLVTRLRGQHSHAADTEKITAQSSCLRTHRMKDYSCFNRQKRANGFPVTAHPASAHIPPLITPGGTAFPLLPCGGPTPAGVGSELGSLSQGPQKSVCEPGASGGRGHVPPRAPAATLILRSSMKYGPRPFYSSHYGWRRPAPPVTAEGLRRYSGQLGPAGGAATRSVTGHGCRDPLAAAEPPARPAQQGRGPPGRRERRAPHPQGGRRHHGRRGQVTRGPLPAGQGKAGPGGGAGVGAGAAAAAEGNALCLCREARRDSVPAARRKPRSRRPGQEGAVGCEGGVARPARCGTRG